MASRSPSPENSRKDPGIAEKVALLGATGAIGKSVAVALRQEGRPYRVIGRSRAALDKTFGGDRLAEVATWDPENEATIRDALKGVTALVYMVGVPYTEFHLHPILMRRVLSGKIRTTVLRLPDFHGPGMERSLLSDLFIAVKHKRRAKLLGPIDRPHEFVFVPDVGPVVARLLDTPAAFGRAWNLGGAGVTTQRELARLAYGGPPRCLVAGKTMLRLLGLLDPFLRELVELHYLLTDPLIVDDSALQRLIGVIAKTPYAEGVRQSLAAAG